MTTHVPATARSQWRVPALYGYAAAVHSMGSVSAPLLAGISVALVGLVISSQGAFHWPSIALLFLTAATLSLLASVQCAFWARLYLVTPADLAEWWGRALDDPARLEAVQEEQRSHRAAHNRWAMKARHFYNGGIVSFLLALAALLVPKGGLDHASATRLAAVGLALAGFIAELVWIAVAWRAGHPTEDA